MARKEDEILLRGNAKKPLRKRLFNKLLFYFIVFSALFVLYFFFQKEILEILQRNPYVWSAYNHIKAEIAGRTMLGIFYAAFFGSLFFVMMPIEALFLFYAAEGKSILLVASIAIGANLLGMVLNYLAGLVAGKRILRFFLRASYDNFHEKIEKYGFFIVFFGNILIFPIEIVTLVLGAARYNFAKFVVYTLLGKSVKFALLIYLAKHFAGYLAFIGI